MITALHSLHLQLTRPGLPLCTGEIEVYLPLILFQESSARDEIGSKLTVSKDVENGASSAVERGYNVQKEQSAQSHLVGLLVFVGSVDPLHYHEQDGRHVRYNNYKSY